MPKVVLVTGASRGLGRALGEKFLEQGCTVILGARSFKTSPTALQKLSRENRVYLDVTSEGSVQELFSWTKKKFKRLDVLVNNAGVYMPGLFESKAEVWRKLIETNLSGALYCAKEATRLMEALGGGRIVQIGSIAGKQPLKNSGLYSATKFGLWGLHESINLSKSKVQSLYVTLGATYTDSWKSVKGLKVSDLLNAREVADVLVGLSLLPLKMRVEDITLLPRVRYI